MWQIAGTYDWVVEQWDSFAAAVRRLIHFIAANRKAAAVAAVGVLTTAALIIGYIAWKSQQDSNAAGILFKAVSQLGSSSGTAEETAKDREEGLRLLQEVTTRYPETAAAAEATLRLANVYYSQGKYDEARDVYVKYLSKNPRGRIAFSAGIGIGDTYLSQKRYDKAVETYSSLIDRFPKEPLLPEAYLNLARTYVLMARVHDASRLYTKVAETYPNTVWAQNAQAQLRKLIHR